MKTPSQHPLHEPSGPGAASYLLTPIQEFIHATTSSGIILILCTIIALIWANSPWPSTYFHLLEVHLSINLGTLTFDKPLHTWINDGLMALFFFYLGLELKRETLVGELSSLKQAALPLIAAIGGALIPALIYTLLNIGKPGLSGWGISMATDTAFALGILALLGQRIPLSLKIFLTAFAIFDDIIAVLTIALFYNHGINLAALGAAAIIFAALIFINHLGIRRWQAYALLGILLWLAILQSGIHATIAGILLASTIPVGARIDKQEFLANSHSLLNSFQNEDTPGLGLFMNEQQEQVMRALAAGYEHLTAPLQRMEHSLHTVIYFVVIPLFVLANAGVSLSGFTPVHLFNPVTLGIILALVLGKQAILLFVWLSVKLKLSELPESVSWLHIYGVSWLGGIGFTMSLFIASLAFEDTQPLLLTQAKVGILIALVLSGVSGYLTLLRTGVAIVPVSDPA